VQEKERTLPMGLKDIEKRGTEENRRKSGERGKKTMGGGRSELR